MPDLTAAERAAAVAEWYDHTGVMGTVADIEERIRDAILAAEQAAREKALEDAAQATYAVDLLFDQGHAVRDAIRALSPSLARGGKGEGT